MKHTSRSARAARGILAMGLLFGVGHASSDELADLPVYEGKNDQFGEIRIWGNQTMTALFGNLQNSIMSGGGQRGLRFISTMPSGSAAIGPLYTGVADLGVMGHHIWPVEIEGFHQVFGYDPFEIIIATGAYDVQAKMPANVFFVHKDNPLTKISMEELDGVLADQRTGGWDGRNWKTESRRGPESNIRTWGQLGLTGEWADKPIAIYGYDLTGSSFPFSIQRMVMGGGGKWSPQLDEYVLNEVSALYSSGPRPRQGCEIMLEAMAKDRYAITYSAIQCARGNDSIKPLAIARTKGGDYIEPTKENFRNRTYPLVESIYVYINREPGKPVEPKVKEFLKYILSRQGQAAVAQSGYLPLTAEAVHEQLRRLE